MDRYIGLDVHMQSCTMAVMGSSGKHVREEVVATNGRDLVEAIRGVEGRRHLCLEEGTQSEWGTFQESCVHGQSSSASNRA